MKQTKKLLLLLMITAGLQTTILSSANDYQENNFLNKEYRYLDIGEHRYWQIDIILNRTRNDQPSKRIPKN